MEHTMNSWIITATVDIPDGPTVEGAAELELAERYASTLPAAVAAGGNGRVTVDFAVDATDLDSAYTEARRLFTVRAGWRLVELRVRTERELEAELARPALPGLVGITEAAEILGVSRQRAHVLAAGPDFPTAVAHLAAGPVYLEASVRAFAERPRTSGRPRKSDGAAYMVVHPSGLKVDGKHASSKRAKLTATSRKSTRRQDAKKPSTS